MTAKKLVGWSRGGKVRRLLRFLSAGYVREAAPMVMVCYELHASQVSSDEDLVRLSHTGNVGATERLLARYRPLVENKARAYFLLGADHDDVVQEGMIGLFKAIRDYSPTRLSRFRGFADLCVTRQIITAVKSATRQKHLPLNAYMSLDHTPSDDGEAEVTLLECLPDPHSKNPQECLVRRGEMFGRLDAARRVLSPLEVRVLEGYLNGKTYREMSAEFHCQTKTVDNAIQRIKRKLGETRLPD